MNNAMQSCERRYDVRYFATVIPLMHVQGNQNVPICLEEKQFCTKTEQHKQLAREVLSAFDAAAAQTRRGRLLHGMSLRGVSSIVWRSERTAGTFSGNSTESTRGAIKTHDVLRACNHFSVKRPLEKTSILLRWC